MLLICAAVALELMQVLNHIRLGQCMHGREFDSVVVSGEHDVAAVAAAAAGF